MITVTIAVALACAVAILAYRLHALSLSGAIAAIAVGTIVMSARGLPGAAVLFAFFIPSTLLSRIGRARKRALRTAGKQGARDAWQVLANGGIAAVAAFLSMTGDRSFAAAFAGAFAAASADTWSTEIGTLVRAMPRSILTFKPMATGLSGGISLAGTLASFAGAVVVALVAQAVGVAAFAPVAIGGIAGAFADSIAGASAQALRWCPACAMECETNPHDCGTPTALRRGLAWIENDAVNLTCTLCGALIAGALASILRAGPF